MKKKIGMELFLWVLLLIIGITEFSLETFFAGACGLGSYILRRSNRGFTGWSFFWIWVAIMGVVQLSFDMVVVGALGALYCMINGGRLYKKRDKKEKLSKKQMEVTENLNQYLEKHPELKISNHVSISRQRPLKTYMDAIVYYDGELVGTLKEFKNKETFIDTYATIEEHMIQLSNIEGFVDDNKNGIDDREEGYINAGYFSKKIESYMSWFTSPNITAGLKAVSQQLEDVQKIVEKYPQCELKLRKLNTQYLPLLITILDQYRSLKEKRASQDELTVIEVKLEKTLILISEAITNLMASFASEDLVSVSADMTVLEAILKRDGLVKEGVMGGAGDE